MWKDLVLILALVFLVTPNNVLAASGSTYIEPWLVGIIAVCGFLVLAFVFLLFNHFVCEKYLYDKDENYDDFEKIEENNHSVPNVYENGAFDHVVEETTEL